MAVEYVVLRFIHVYSHILIYVFFLQFPPSFGRSFEGETQYLERGRQGVAACPALLGAGLIPSEVPVIYWYLGPITRDALPFIVKNEGNILFGDGVPVGLYDINDELSLIISQVRNSSAGTYYCRLAPQRLAFQDASVPIEVIVSPDPDELPVVSPCDEKPIPSLCEISTDQSVIGLTCKVKNTFPAVELQIWRFPAAGDGNKVVQLKDVVIETEQVTVPLLGNLTENERLRTDNTFTSTASVEVEVGVRGGVFICNSSGPVPGKGKSTLVVISKEVPVAPTTQTTSHATTFKTGVKTTNEETTMSSVETGDTEATCEMLGRTIILILTLLFAILWLVSIVLSQRVTVLKIKCLHRGGTQHQEEPQEQTEQTTEMLDQNAPSA